MDKLEFTEGLAKKIIKDQHQFFDTNKSEDLEHITNIKRIIVSISDYLSTEGVPEDKINDLDESLRDLTRQLYIGSCIKNRDEDEDKDVVAEESEVWFDFIYENEKYPR
jgi:hypothetical protein